MRCVEVENLIGFVVDVERNFMTRILAKLCLYTPLFFWRERSRKAALVN